eukprot:PhF_6_TR15675/c0_g1_i1/m.24371
MLLRTVIFLLASVICAHGVKPILVMPGIMGSVLQSKRVNATQLPWECKKNADWSRAWIDLTGVTVEYPCWSATMELGLSPNGTSISPNGIQVRPHPNTTEGVACLDPYDAVTCGATLYMRDFFYFMQSKGYNQTWNLDAFPYDF